MDCLMSFPDFLYAFQSQFFYEGKLMELVFVLVLPFFEALK